MFLVRILCAALCLLNASLWAAGLPMLGLHTNDVVAFIGGSDVASSRSTGHLEAMLAVKWPGLRLRNFGWEGDTVFVQRRDVGFPPTTEHVKRVGAKLAFLQFGRAEALDSQVSVTNFYTAYEKLALEYARIVPHIILVTPVPFERSEPPLPDLFRHNSRFEEFVLATRALGASNKWPVVSLFWDPVGHFGWTRLASDGLQFTPRGQALIAEEFDRRIGFGEIAPMVGKVYDDGSWGNPRFEQLRQLVLEKNQLWFNYWRPQNWAFLGGDRTTQPSSRDHRDPKVRWFPAEMEKYAPLIAAQESEMEAIASEIRGGAR